jgi:protein-tyrosine phosphatase
LIPAAQNQRVDPRFVPERFARTIGGVDMLSEIVPLDDEEHLFLSAAIDNWQPILDRGINVVIDLEGDVDHGVPTDVDHFLYVYLPIHDGEMPDLDRLHAVAKMAATLLKRGDRVLSHCGLGLNRSALMAALILMYNGMSAPDAVERLQTRRPGALYNDVFRNYLLSGLVR